MKRKRCSPPNPAARTAFAAEVLLTVQRVDREIRLMLHELRQWGWTEAIYGDDELVRVDRVLMSVR